MRYIINHKNNFLLRNFVLGQNTKNNFLSRSINRNPKNATSASLLIIRRLENHKIAFPS